MENASVERERLRSFISVLNLDLSGKSDDECKRFAFDRQLERAAKKYRISDNNLRDIALSDFVFNNNLAGKTKSILCGEDLHNARLFICRALEIFTRGYSPVPQENLDLDLLLSLWRYGPGASQGTRSTHFCDKIQDESVTSTIRVVQLYKQLRLQNHHLRFLDEAGLGQRVEVIIGSRLTTVPKNDRTDRTIATEPLCNMALQLAAGVYIEGALRSVGLDISRQETLNKALAHKGSIDHSLATIDLKAASDFITFSLIDSLWPPDWCSLFRVIRSPATEIRCGSPHDGIYKLNMVSTMGNGFTFPMMTLTLLSLVYAVMCKHKRTKGFRLDYGTVGVYGDDIIVPTTCYDDMVAILTDAGLKVNLDKSYCSGDFRESCGGDYFRGYNVTPFYVKSLQTDSEVYVAINQLLKWSASHSRPMFNTFDFLRSLLTKPENPLVVPYYEDPSSGINSNRAKRRYAKLEIVPKRVIFNINHPSFIWAASSGYVSSFGGKPVYVRRARKARYRLVKCCVTPKALHGNTHGKDNLTKVSHHLSRVYRRSLTSATYDYARDFRDDVRRGLFSGRSQDCLTTEERCFIDNFLEVNEM